MEKSLLRKKARKKQLKMKKMWENSGVKVSKSLRDIIHGYTMSDGFIRNGILTVDQNVKQKLFVLWLYEKFQHIRTSSPIKEVSRIHPKTKRTSQSLRFFTKAVLNGFHSMWYKPVINKEGVLNYKKKLPKNMSGFFNETFISVWYAADGTKILGSLGAKFEVTSFTIVERLKLKALFFSKFQIKTEIISSGVSKNGNPQWALKIPAKEYPKFRNLITKLDLIPTLFPYKLHKKKTFSS